MYIGDLFMIMFNCTENSFTCASRINIIGIDFVGTGWFLTMLVIAFGLQISANFIWLKNSQLSREILQLNSNDTKRTPLICANVAWTALSTLVWIARIVFVIGNNIWMFIVILLGNVIGTYYASQSQSADEDTTMETILKEFANPNETTKQIMGYIRKYAEKGIVF
tara:strand:+ start:1527 stop:2024 length:498 start_codon:yes stop_codon:yes gene_type:complete